MFWELDSSRLYTAPSLFFSLLAPPRYKCSPGKGAERGDRQTYLFISGHEILQPFNQDFLPHGGTCITPTQSQPLEPLFHFTTSSSPFIHGRGCQSPPTLLARAAPSSSGAKSSGYRAAYPSATPLGPMPPAAGAKAFFHTRLRSNFRIKIARSQ